MAFSPEGMHIAVGSTNSGMLMVYDLRKTSKPVVNLEGHKYTINCIQYKSKESGVSRVKLSEATLSQKKEV